MHAGHHSHCEPKRRENASLHLLVVAPRACSTVPQWNPRNNIQGIDLECDVRGSVISSSVVRSPVRVSPAWECRVDPDHSGRSDHKGDEQERDQGDSAVLKEGRDPAAEESHSAESESLAWVS